MSETVSEALLDVLVIGGGLAGGCTGALLQRAAGPGRRPLTIAVLEPARPRAPLAGTPFEARVSALSRASERILASAGAWKRIAGPRVQPYERMRVWHHTVRASSEEVLVFDAADAGEPNLGWIAENRLVQAAVVEAFETAGGRLIVGELEGLKVHDRHIEALTTAGTFAARLITRRFAVEGRL